MDKLLLSACLHDRTAFDTLARLKALDDFSDQQKIVLGAISEYYKKDAEADCADKELIKSSLERTYPKHAEMLCQMVDGMEKTSIPNLVDSVVELKRQRKKEELCAAFANSNNDDQIEVLLEEYDSLKTGLDDNKEDPITHNNKSVSSILEKASSEAKIEIMPDAIQEATGGCLRGHHILVFARPDCGKTTLAIQMAYGFLKQGLRVMYIGNEDPADEINFRFLTRLTHMSKEQIEADPERCQRIADKRNYDKFFLVEMCPGTPAEIAREVAKIKPDVLMVDQARNISMGGKFSKVEALEAVEQFIRNLGKKHDMVTVSFTQGGDSAEGKLYLTMCDVDYSNTGMQASADLMVGMGVNQEWEKLGKRMLSFPKNKLSGFKEGMEVYFDPRLNSITSTAPRRNRRS